MRRADTELETTPGIYGYKINLFRSIRRIPNGREVFTTLN